MQAHAKFVIHRLGTCTFVFLPRDVSSPVSSPPVDFVCHAASKTISITMEGFQGCGASGGFDPPPLSSRLSGPGDPTHDRRRAMVKRLGAGAERQKGSKPSLPSLRMGESLGE